MVKLLIKKKERANTRSHKAHPNHTLLYIYPDHIHRYYMEIDHVEYGIDDYEDWEFEDHNEYTDHWEGNLYAFGWRPIIYTPYDIHGVKVNLQALME